MPKIEPPKTVFRFRMEENGDLYFWIAECMLHAIADIYKTHGEEPFCIEWVGFLSNFYYEGGGNEAP